jgi:Domain of unknown function (DUF3786)
MPKKDAYHTAVRFAIEKLNTVDLPTRCRNLGLPQPQSEELCFRAFGEDVVLRLKDWQLFPKGSQEPVKIFNRILVLHYLLCDLPVVFTDRLISFRELIGGQFYWEPFCARSVRPLGKRFGNQLEQLKENLERFDWEPVSIGDLGARVHAIGNLYVTLIYRLGDDEFPAAADLLFDSAIKRIYNAEDATVLASRICLALL